MSSSNITENGIVKSSKKQNEFDFGLVNVDVWSGDFITIYVRMYGKSTFADSEFVKDVNFCLQATTDNKLQLTTDFFLSEIDSSMNEKLKKDDSKEYEYNYGYTEPPNKWDIEVSNTSGDTICVNGNQLCMSTKFTNTSIIIKEEQSIKISDSLCRLIRNHKDLKKSGFGIHETYKNAYMLEVIKNDELLNTE